MRLALFGASSEIGLAILEQYGLSRVAPFPAESPDARAPVPGLDPGRVIPEPPTSPDESPSPTESQVQSPSPAKAGAAEFILVGRDSPRRTAAAERLRQTGTTVRLVGFDATDRDGWAAAVEAVFAGGVVDVVVVAFGQLPDPMAWRDPERTAEIGDVNFTAAAAIGSLLAAKLAGQGSGQIIALSSVAGQRVRRSNFLYGATKAGFDAFYLGLGEALRPDGIHVLVARPGKVATGMIAALPPTPGTISANRAARDIVRAARRHRPLVWTPGWFRPLMALARLVPQSLWWRINF